MNSYSSDIPYDIFKLVHFDTGAEGDYLAHVTFFARAKRAKNHMS